MPRVTKYGDPKVQSTPLPAARREAHETFESSGGPAGEAISGFGAQGMALTSALLARVEEEAATLEMMTADRELMELDRALVSDPEHGALTSRGLDALAIRAPALELFDRRAGEIEARVHHGKAKAAVARAVINRRGSMSERLDSHADRELTSHYQKEALAHLDSAVDFGIRNSDDLGRVRESLDMVDAGAAEQARLLGLGPDAREALRVEKVTLVHRGVIAHLLNTDQDVKAQAYFDTTKFEISGNQHAAIEAALEVGSTRAEVLRQADAIISAGGTLTEQREKAGAIADPKVRTGVEERIEHEATIKEKTDRDAAEARALDAAHIVDVFQDVTKIPPALWAQLPLGTMSALRGYAKALTEHGDVETDLPTYYRLMRQASDDPAGFATVNLMTHLADLGKVEFKQLAEIQKSIRDGARKDVETALDGFRTNLQIANGSLTLAGIDLTDKKNDKLVARFLQTLDERGQALQRLTGKKATNADVQTIADDLLKSITLEKGSWWNVLPGGAPFSDVSKRLVDLTVADIPAAERLQIEKALRRAKRTVTDDAILNLYLDTKRRTGAVK